MRQKFSDVRVTDKKGKGRPVETHKKSRCVSALTFYLGARWGLGVNATPDPLLFRERALGSDRRGGWVGASVGLGEYGEVSFPAGIRTLDRPASSESPY
jgi:hypothetical protein